MTQYFKIGIILLFLLIVSYVPRYYNLRTKHKILDLDHRSLKHEFDVQKDIIKQHTKSMNKVNNISETICKIESIHIAEKNSNFIKKLNAINK